ncbi:protein chibby homolog 1 [Neocloeon triangulifer]|uniref:protein chibby homolog 1 n=1 Tax=Neocloeon triangulifer TaxID=2078957 RepID=UPI00286F1BA9|nr:protein chibby homolog 1 [Neocloeon triangulifer]
MPLLSGGGRFVAPKIEQRKRQTQDLPADASQLPDEVEMTLDGHTLIFSEGQWISSGSSTGVISGSKREAMRKLEEENNLLKAKLELMMDMLTEMTAQSRLQAKEVKMLRAKLRK